MAHTTVAVHGIGWSPLCLRNSPKTVAMSVQPKLVLPVHCTGHCELL